MSDCDFEQHPEQMSFLGWPVGHHALSGRTQRRRRATALQMMRRFAETFVGIEYDLLWKNPTINAQAWLFANGKHVTVCGGLVRHPALSASGIALILAHETGHHLGGLPFDPDLRCLTWQGQADYWAAKEGMPKVFGDDARRHTLRGAREIAALHVEFLDAENQPDMSASDRSAIFYAGALGKKPPACLYEAFDRLLEERRQYANLKASKTLPRLVEHDPEKWVAVFRKDHAQSKR